MSKKSHIKATFDKQHGKRAKTLLKSSSPQFHHIYWSLWKQLGCKKWLLAIFQILGLVANILSANDKYPVLNRDNLMIRIQMELYQKQKKFSVYFVPYLKSSWNFEYFEKKKLTLLDFVFPKLRTPKTWLDKCLKSPVLENLCTSNMVMGQNTVEINLTAPLSYLWITLKATELEDVSLIGMPELGTAC